MRRSSVEMTAMLRQVRGALLWAAAFSAMVAVCALAGPLTVAFLIAAPAARFAVEDMALVFGFLLLASLLAAALLAARDRIVTRAALWLEHSLGQTALKHGLEWAAAPNEIEQDRKALQELTAAIRGIGALLDLTMIPVSLFATAVIAPLAGFAALIAVCGSLLILSIAGRRASRDDTRTEEATAIADGIWRTAAASSVAIAARGLTATTAASWSQANGRAIARAFKAAEAQSRFALRLQLWQAVSTVGLMAGLLWLVHGNAVSQGAAVAALTLHVVTLSVLGALRRAIPGLLSGRRALARLVGEPDRPTQPVAWPAGAAARPAANSGRQPGSGPPHRLAEAS
jgi:ABC-type protease/lipase transport system fused ATPase/permease subunit